MRWPIRRRRPPSPSKRRLTDGPSPVLTWADAIMLAQAVHHRGQSLHDLFRQIEAQRSRLRRPSLTTAEIRVVAQAWADMLLTDLNARTCRDGLADMPPGEHARRHLARDVVATPGRSPQRSFVIFDFVVSEQPREAVDLIAGRLRMSALARLVRGRVPGLEVLVWTTPTRVVAIARSSQQLAQSAEAVSIEFTRQLCVTHDGLFCGVHAHVVRLPAEPQEALGLLESFGEG